MERQRLHNVFVVGSQRSGTTLLGQIVGAHPHAVLIDENNGVYRLIDALLTAPGDVAEALRASIASAQKLYVADERFTVDGGLHPSVTHLVLKAPNATYAYQSLREAQQGHLHVLFAVRDVRDVVCSMQRLVHVPMVENQLRHLARYPLLAARFSDDLALLQDPSTPLSVQQALVWKIKTGLYTAFVRPPLGALLVRYEDLVSAPAVWIPRVLAHVGLSRSAGTTHHHEDVFQGLAPGFTVRAREIDQTSLYRWRRQLSAEEEEGIWQVASDLMTELGYPRQPPDLPTPRVAISEEALARPIVGTGAAGPAAGHLSRLLREQGVFLGNRLGASGASSEWMDLIYELAIKKLRGMLPNETAWQRELRARATHILGKGAWKAPDPWGWMLPETLLLLPELAEAFPSVRIVHLVRHPVADCLGHGTLARRLNQRVVQAALPAAYDALGWQQDPRDDAAHRQNAALWTFQNSLALRFHRARGNQAYLLLRFEDLAADPQTASDALAAFLGEPPRTTALKATGAPSLPTAEDQRAEDVWSVCAKTARALGYAYGPRALR